MTKLEIEAFLTVVKHGNISVAAEHLFVTQPALSRRIQNLEIKLGYKLFERDKGIRSIMLTERGKAFLPVAQKWNNVYAEAIAIKDLQQNKVLNIAAVSSVSTYILPDILRRFIAEEGCIIDFNCCRSHEGYGLVVKNAADVAIVDYIKKSDINSADTVISTPLFSVPFFLIGGEQLKNTATVHPSQLDPTKEIRLRWNAEFDKWHDYWFDTSILPCIRLNQASLIGAMLHEDLYSIVPEFVAKKILQSNPNCVICELHDGPPDETFYCLTSVNGQHKNEVTRVIEHIKQSFYANRKRLV